MTRKLFESMDDQSRAFYSRVFNTAVLNLHAVRMKYFDVLICETDDPNVMVRWREEVPKIVAKIKLKNAKDL